MANQYTWLTLQGAINALQGRLQNTGFWSITELTVYLNEALRAWNALTEQWNADFVFTASGSTWNNTGTLAGSPRLRTVTDSYLYSQMQYMLLEPPTGSNAWDGTSQFDLQSLQFALQKRRDEVIQATACNLVNLPPVATSPGIRRNVLPDTVLEPIRTRFVPATGNINTLTREDTQAFQYFNPSYLQESGVPKSWSVPSEPPLAFDVDIVPIQAGSYDLIVLQSGPSFSPPNDTLLGVPDDWSWLPMYGALADLLGSETERTDRARDSYCMKRFTDGMKLMKSANWLVKASVNGVPCDTASLSTTDQYSPEWQNDSGAWPSIVQAGTDLVSVTPQTSQSVSLTLVGNAPLPVLLTDFVQVSRDVFDVILSYAQHLADFKMGGAEWASGQSLEADFYRAAAQTNKRLFDLGIFTDVLREAGQVQNEAVPR